MNDLLKEAIADAKSIRDFAIESAKQTMAENFTRQARSIVDSRLNEEEDLFTEEEEDLFAEAEGSAEDEEVLEIEDMEGEAPEDEIEEAYDEDDELSEIIRELESELEEGDDMEDEEFVSEAEDEVEVEEEPKEAPKKTVQEMIAELISEMEGSEESDEDEKEDDKEVVAELKKELAEAYKAIKYLKSKMNEALLINSKLLYTGRLFRNFNLNESQKVTILETFDRASNVRETKLLYATLQTTLSGAKVSTKTKPNRLKESRASKPTGATKSTGKAILAENQLVSRLQVLAGISKSK